METLIQQLQDSTSTPNTDTVEAISRRIPHIVHCFHECSWATTTSAYTSNILYSKTLIISGVKTVFLIVKCPVCNTTSFFIYEYVEPATILPYLYCLFSGKLELIPHILNFFKQYAPHISEVQIPTDVVRTCSRYLSFTLINYFTHLVIQSKQKHKLMEATDTNAMVCYCASHTPSISPVQQILSLICSALNRSSVSPALLYYLFTIPTLSLDMFNE